MAAGMDDVAAMVVGSDVVASREHFAQLAACGGDTTPPDACQPAVLYLNKAGGMWDHGARDDASQHLSILVDAPRALRPWPKGATDRGLLVAAARTNKFPETKFPDGLSNSGLAVRRCSEGRAENPA